MKTFILKWILICLGILFVIHFIYIVTNDKDEFCVKYTDIEIINNIPGQYIEWQGTNSYNYEVETFTAEYCKKCGNHLINVDYYIEDLESGTIYYERTSAIIIYSLLWIFFLFMIPIIDAYSIPLYLDEKITIIKHVMIFLGYNKDKLEASIKDFNCQDMKQCINCHDLKCCKH